MKAFITGGAGFIGSCMSDRLLLGPANTVTVYDNFALSESGSIQHISAGDRFRVVRADLFDLAKLQEALAGHDIVFHFASNTDTTRGLEDHNIDLNQNVLATHNVLEAMRLNAIKKLVFLSDHEVYGDLGGRPAAEHHGPITPVSLHGASKLAAEALICAYANLYGITTYIFRLADVVGARQTHGIAYDFIEKLRQDPFVLPITGDGKQARPYIHVDDVLNAIFFVMAMVAEKINIVNIATDDTIELDWIADAVLQAMRLPNVEKTHSGGERSTAGVIPVARLDTSKIRKLGWFPKYGSQQAMTLAIDQMLEYMKQRA
jgi:UDP-glucose 4-epimerase